MPTGVEILEKAPVGGISDMWGVARKCADEIGRAWRAMRDRGFDHQLRWSKITLAPTKSAILVTFLALAKSDGKRGLSINTEATL